MRIDIYMYMYYNISINRKGDKEMKKITNVRKVICTMANRLRKEGYSLSQAFRKAWRRVKVSMKIRATGTCAENRQERLEFLKSFPVNSLQVELVRDQKNHFDRSAIQVVIHVLPIKRKTVVGYVPRGLASSLAAVMDAGLKVKAELLQIIGGYSYKEHYGCLISIDI